MDEVDNHIGEEGARYISVALRENSSLLFAYVGGECFSFSLSFIDFFISIILMMLLFELSSFGNCINVIENEIGPEGARHISDALCENSSLLLLNIRSESFSLSLSVFLS